MIFLTDHPDHIHCQYYGQSEANLKLKAEIKRYLGCNVFRKNPISTKIKQKLPDIYPVIQKYNGLHLLDQNNYEVLISFMCAQGLGLSLIRHQIATLCLTLGPAIYHPENQNILGYGFPKAERLANATLKTLKTCTNNNAIRARNIRQVARSISNGRLDLNALSVGNATYTRARDTLVTHGGIGEKIADCVCLFGLGHPEAIPIDRHVRDYLAELFNLKTPTKSLSTVHYRHLADQAREILGPEHPGLCSQIIFHYWRKEVKQLTAF